MSVSKIMFGIAMMFCLPLQAASLADSILEIPRGSIFTLRAELEVPANRNFIELGRNELTATFNELNQPLNQQKGRYGYHHYNHYLNRWQESVSDTYRDCLERHRTYYSYGGSTGSNSTIVNQGRGNTNIIINNQPATTPSYGSYIDHNTCIKPDHTIAMLLLDEDEAGAGGIFREGYEFKVRSVRQRKYRHVNVVSIRFDHKIAKELRVITTQSPENIAIHQLQYQDYGDGFLQGLGAAIAGITDIGGDYFSISIAEKRYFD